MLTMPVLKFERDDNITQQLYSYMFKSNSPSIF